MYICLTRFYLITRSQRVARLRDASPFGRDDGWRLLAMIVKADDEILQVSYNTLCSG